MTSAAAIEIEQLSLFDRRMRDEFRARLRGGESLNCPCCDRFAKIYRRALHAGIAAQMIRLYRHGGVKNFLHITQFCDLNTGADIPLARHWGLVEPLPHTPGVKKTSGFWKLTPLGERFVLHDATIPRYALLYDDNVLRLEGDKIAIRDALRQQFDYEKMMQE